MSSRKVAIIMSVYISDSVSNIELAVESILEQSYVNLDIYIYVDGEIEDDVQVLLDYLDINYDNIIITSNPSNMGLAYALNTLINKVLLDEDVKYIARMDSDDISRPDRIAKQVSAMSELNVDVLGGYCKEFGASFALEEKRLPLTHNELVEFSITRCPFIHPTVMFRKDIFIDSSLRYPEKTQFTEDMAFWFVLLSKGFKFSNIPEVLLDYRLSENTVNRRKGFMKCWSEVRLRVKYMLKLKKVSSYNIAMILSRFIFHLMPSSMMKLMYRRMR
ncbi:glycosyltransferase [Vibrio cyclitrophicus]